MKLKNIILDAGHGAINPSTGKYVTPGKRAKLNDGTWIYEGVINRQLVSLIAKHLKDYCFNIQYTVKPTDYRDINLSSRVKFANGFDPLTSLFVSIHFNASQSRKGKGFEIFTSVGRTKADVAATAIGLEVKKLYDKLKLRLRFDYTDGDLDKEVNFYVLKNTRAPAVLIEVLFFDNEEDAKFILNKNFMNSVAKAIAMGIFNYGQLNG